MKHPRTHGDKEEALKKWSLTVLAAVFMMVGCSESGTKAPAVGSDADVVARVGDKVISDSQVEQFLGNLPPQVSGRYGSDRIRREIVDGFISMELLAWEARRRGIDKRDDVKIKLDMLVDQALAREIEDELRKGISVEESEIKAYYEENKDRYGGSRRIHARMITVPTEGEMKSVLEKFRKGEDFAVLARQYSKDEHAAKGGSLGMVKPGKLPPELDQVVFSLNEGDVSTPVKTGQGYVVVQADKVVQSPEKPYDQVKKSIERVIMREKLNKAVGDMKDEIRKKTTVEINEDYFARHRGQDQPPEAVMPPAGMAVPDGENHE